MRTLSPDTSPEAERVQIALFRQASPARRFALARSLSRTALSLSREGVRRRHPELDAQEVLCRWVALQYGSALAERLRADLAARGLR